MHHSNNYIRLLTSADQGLYLELLKSAFAKPKHFTAAPATIRWTSTDDFYPVFGLFYENQLVSMMRAEWIETDREFLIKYDEQQMPKAYRYPIGYLAKAATIKGFEGRAFNSILRYHCLRLYRNWGVQSVIGFMVEGSPRVNIMREMGYQFFYKSKKWDGNFKSENRVLVGELSDPKAIEKAIDFLETRFPVDIVLFENRIDLSQLPMKGRISHRFPWND
jgi:hypothetical protein